jgi:hypothetical protein
MTRIDQKEALYSVAVRLRGEAIRRQHDTGEAFIDGRWFDYHKHGQAANDLLFQAESCLAAIA